MAWAVCLVGGLCMWNSISWEIVAVSSYFSLCEINLMCHFVSAMHVLGIRPTTRTHITQQSDALKNSVCVYVFETYELMVAKCCSFFALSYSFQSINKFDRLIRINRPNYMRQVSVFLSKPPSRSHLPRTLLSLSDTHIKCAQKVYPYFISLFYMFYLQ